MNLCNTYRHTLITVGHWTQLDDYITSFFWECYSKQLSMQTLKDHVPLNGWFLSSTCLKDQSLFMSGGRVKWVFTENIIVAHSACMHSLRHLVHVGCEVFSSCTEWAEIIISMNSHFEPVINNDRSLFMEIIIAANSAGEEKISQPTQYLPRYPLRP